VPTISSVRLKTTWLQFVIHCFGWLPLVWILYKYFTGKLSVNPIQNIEQQLGHLAVYFLIASLACTPIYTLSGWSEPIKHRRTLGLYCFLYASLHVLTFTGIDYGFNLRLIGDIVLKKPYAFLGFATYILLIPLAVTSFRWWMKKLGRKWTNLHRLIYLAAILDILHYAWAKKGNIFELSGDIVQPLLWGLLVLLLLALRIPLLRRLISGFQQKTTNHLG
jgi:sulfoxide reductase heme-binding subunit YedZ